MSRFFIDRPIFAWVIAILIMMAGLLAMKTLPIAQYPSIAPPSVQISTVYPGASAQTVQNSVTQEIEQQLTGLDGLLYFSSTSTNTGAVTITATFQAGTNPDIAQVQVQNKVQAALPLLPSEVQQQGVVVQKTNSSVLLIVAIDDPNGRYSSQDLSDVMVSTMQDPIARVTGVGSLNVFGSQHAMRIWLDPYKLANFNLNAGDVRTALMNQNVQVPAGQLGRLPTAPGQELNATVTAQSQLQTPDQFAKVVLKTQASGAVVTIADIGRVEMGMDSYDVITRLNGHQASAIALQLAPGANALTTVDAVKARAMSLKSSLPPGVELSFPVDNTQFIKISIWEVVKTLFEAIVLVVIVMFIFLQNWRATLIPAVAVPVVLLGTMGVLAVFHYSINTLTMFGMVLVIGLLVDDAIVVVENVERIMDEEHISPKDATRKSMDEITGALVGIALVLTAVLLPMAFFGGSTGVIYRQFSVTMVSAILLSVFVALTLSPALCATLLKPRAHDAERERKGFFGWFNRTFDKSVHRYEGGLHKIVAKPKWMVVGYGFILVLMVGLFVIMPTGFLPEEDQGQLLAQVNLPVGATQGRTLAVLDKMQKQFLKADKANIQDLITVAGFSFSGSGQNAGIAFMHLKPWDQRKGFKNSAQGIAQRNTGAFMRDIRDAQIYAIVPPAVSELGLATGFDMELENRGNLTHEQFLAARNQLLGMASQDPLLAQVRPNGLEDQPQLHVDTDTAKAGALGVDQADINTTLTAAWGGIYVDDFIDRDRIKRVYIEGDAPYRAKPENLNDWQVRNASGSMTPFSAFAKSSWTFGPAQLTRYNGFQSYEIQGQAKPGKSSGEAMAEMQKLIGRLPQGVGFEWTGLSYQEVASGNQAPLLYGLTVLVVFLCLAALYESWSIPTAVMFVLPLGIVGALLAAKTRGLYNDIYFQVGLLTTMGLAAKNAILIVEFAVDGQKRGEGAVEAAINAAKQRLRPILMTSLAFIAGVMPLAITTGAGAGSENDIGTGVIGGMITATVLAIFFVPLSYVLVRKIFPAPIARTAQVGEGGGS